ncbi:hypothetical protein UA08_00268 [Talaromyces atroroseus]|uniref:Carbohydrate kinase PfkB domain-containing protein n=1 Tax=Talaromyces atroroseus TaxID=1441469 RepID=A0A225APS0_TALAT|nr:hypothetical protein UA08_00268 [Talaromyces atroroseus]OKL63632.1 hypothetical protein UA08_00268 [Talaromyces atroroseus]
MSRRRGGNCPNSLEVMQQLVDLTQSKLSLDLICVLPERESMSTRFITQTLGSDVNCSCCIYRQHLVDPASCYVFKSRETGSRTIVNYNELPEMTFDEFKSSVEKLGSIEDTCFHFEIKPSALISVELENPHRLGLENLAAEADFVFYAKSWAQAFGYSSMEKCLEAQITVLPKAKYLCCTWGDKGAALLTRPENACISMPALAIPNAEVVDPIGAGDTFVAGMLFGILCYRDDWDQTRKLQFATELASLKVRQEGFQGLGSVVGHRIERR